MSRPCRCHRYVSTRSRPKAAGLDIVVSHRHQSFNTQPPEGGWLLVYLFHKSGSKFQHAAARRRLAVFVRASAWQSLFQHAAARRRLGLERSQADGTSSFNTQPPEGGWTALHVITYVLEAFQHAAARRRLDRLHMEVGAYTVFQHAAARRRLGYNLTCVNFY